MKRERAKRISLYVSAALSWVAAGFFLWAVHEYDTRLQLGWLFMVLTLAGTLTGASVLVAIIAPLEQVFYKVGFKNGQRASVRGDSWKTAVPMRVLHTDS